MNDKLTQHIRNALISLAIGFIISGSSGILFKAKSFYYCLYSDGKIEVSEYAYNHRHEVSDDDCYYEEKTFNLGIAFPTGLISYGLCFLLLTGIDTKRKKFKSEILEK